MGVHEDFKKENYPIPIHTVGGSTRPDAVSATSGSAIIAVSGSDAIGSLTVFGTRVSSTKITHETLTIATTSGTTGTITDWANIYGMRFGDIYGVAAFSTISCDISLVSAANTSHELANISSSQKSIKAQLYKLDGQNVTLHNTTGNIWYKPEATLPTSNNAFKLLETMVRDVRIGSNSPFLMVESDTGGASVQIIVHQD